MYAFYDNLSAWLFIIGGVVAVLAGIIYYKPPAKIASLAPALLCLSVACGWFALLAAFET